MSYCICGLLLCGRSTLVSHHGCRRGERIRHAVLDALHDRLAQPTKLETEARDSDQEWRWRLLGIF